VFIILAPTSSLIPIATEVGAERRMYLPLAAIVLLVVAAAQRLPFKPAIATAAAMLLAAGTVARNAEYRDGLTLWESTLARWPTPRAHRNVATELKRSGRAAEALIHVRQSITPEHPEARYALGYELLEQGHHQEAAAELTRFIREVPRDPNVGSAHALAASALLKDGRYAEALPHLREAARRRPGLVESWVTLGVTLAEMRDFTPAEAALRKAVSIAPRHSTARMMLGLVLAAQGRLQDATTELRVAIAVDPSNAEAREHLARIEVLLRGAS
jgi:Flp pilus assembly protein TadD